MRKIFQSMLAVAVLATGSLTYTTPQAAAQGVRIEVGPRGVEVDRVRDRDRGRSYCDRNPRARECRGYDRRDRHWDRGDRGRDRYHGPRPSRASVARCAQRYRSYDPRTHTYVVNSRGDRRVCRL
jgi:Ni/Co efflux regulator RcnB